MSYERQMGRYTCDLCGMAVHPEDVASRVALAPFGLCCSECRDHNYQHHHHRAQSVASGFSAAETCLLKPIQIGPDGRVVAEKPPVPRPAAPPLNPRRVPRRVRTVQVPAALAAAASSADRSAVSRAGGASNLKLPSRVIPARRIRVRIRRGKFYLDFGTAAQAPGGNGSLGAYVCVELSSTVARKLAEHLLHRLAEDESAVLPLAAA